MEFWLSGEIDEAVYDGYRTARAEIEEGLNQDLLGNDYGPIKEFAFIAIIMKQESRDFDEVAEFKRGEAELRLKIPYKLFFQEKSDSGRRKLVLEAVLRGVGMLAKMKGAEQVRVDQMLHDIRLSAQNRGLM